MNPDIKARWVAWLRANVDKQGRGRLQGPDGFCCLGGLCELAVEDGVILSRESEDEPGAIEYGDEVNGWDSSVLPLTVICWAEIEDAACGDLIVILRVPSGDGFATETNLTNLNDGLNWDFNQIADIIDEQL
jgi:hypothetical protein